MKNILIVDDDPMSRLAISHILTSNNFEVITANDGDEAARLLKKYTPDAVITDIIMPEKDGIALILDIKKKYPLIRIIAVSGGGKIDAGTHLGLAKDLGVHEIIQKPISAEKLLAALNYLNP